MLRRQRAAWAAKNRSRLRLCAVLSPPQFGNPAKPSVSLIRVAKPSYTTRTLCAIAQILKMNVILLNKKEI